MLLAAQQFTLAQSPTLGTYPTTIITNAGGNGTIIPSAAPGNTTNITAISSTGFKGVLYVNPITGIVSVTNAHPAGSYTVTVRGFTGSASTSASFSLNVNNAIGTTGCNQTLFNNRTTVGVANAPRSITIGDFNNDSKQDMLFASFASNTVTLALGNGSGGFTITGTIPVGNLPFGIAVGDLNGDGNLDFACTNAYSNDVSICLGNGAGAFVNAGLVSVGINANPEGIVIGDFNGDGKLDFATGNSTTGNVSICIGDGLGAFGSATIVTAGSRPGSLTIGDFNSDGKQDIATANYFDNNISVRLGNGAGGFTNAPNIVASNGPFFITTGDFNNDGKQDLVTANKVNNSVSVRLGDGAGNFSGTTNVPVGKEPVCVTIGDFNGDGNQDFVTSNNGDSTATIGFGTGSGNFVTPTNMSLGFKPDYVTLGNFDIDGKQDLAFSNFSQGTISVFLASPGIAAIDILGNGILIADGDISPSLTDSTDFGDVSVALSHRYVIKNAGNYQLVVSGVNTRGGDSSLFTVSGISFPKIIAAGDSAVFRVGFAPVSLGVKTTTVMINSDNCNKPTYDFAIKATSLSQEFSYPSTTVKTGHNAIINPVVAPSGLTGITALTNTNFKGMLNVDPVTGIVRVTNAHPAGNYVVTVRSFTGASVSTVSFNLNVTHPANCSNIKFVNGGSTTAATTPSSGAIGDFNNDGKQDLAITNTGSNNVSIRLGNGSGGFSGTTTIAVGTSPYSVAVGDFNGDGKQDLVTANYNSNNVSILMGDGSGGFTSGGTVTVGTKPYFVALGDFNNDGKQDLVTANPGNGTISVCLGNGNGTFAAAASSSVGTNPEAIAIGDLNNDGKQDLAVVTYDNTIAIRLGNGSGGFTNAANVSTGSGAFSIVIGDFDNDGKQDLATAGSMFSSISMHTGEGNGTFVAPIVSVGVGAAPYSLAMGDFNGDGLKDLATANYNANTVSIRLGQSGGGFVWAGEVATGTQPRCIMIGNLNGDSRQDLAIINESGTPVSIRLATPAFAEIDVRGNSTNIVNGNITPSVADHTDFGNVSSSLTRNFTIRNTGSDSLTITGITITGADSAMFVLNAITFPLTIRTGDTIGLKIRFTPVSAGVKSANLTISNDDCDEGSFSFSLKATAVSSPPVLASYSSAIIAAPGRNAFISPSIAPSNAASILATTTPNFKGTIHVNPVTGVVNITNAHPAGIYTISLKAINFSATTTTNFTLTVNNTGCRQASFSGYVNTPTGNNPRATIVCDFNNDGKQDLLVANSAGNSVSVQPGNGSGGFTGMGTIAVSGAPYSITAADFNGDGNQDFATANYSNATVSVRMGDGSGNFGALPDLVVGTNPYAVATGDFNGDGNPDLAVANGGTNNVSICLGSGSGSFSTLTSVAVGTGPQSLHITDVNGDGKADFVTANFGSNNMSVRLGNGAGGFTNATNVAASTNPVFVTTGDFNNDGKQDLAAANFGNGTVSVRLGDGAGNFTGTSNVSVGTNPVAVVLGDFNGDGNLDFGTTNYGDSSVALRLGNGTGVFTGSSLLFPGCRSRSLVAGDFNGDGRQDLAVTNEKTNATVSTLAIAGTAEIEVSGNNNLIVSGDITTSVTDHTDFGNSTSGNLVRPFVIRNTGLSGLTISGIDARGGDSAMFKINGISFPFSIAAGDSTVFEVGFLPQNTGIKSTTVLIRNDDCDEMAYTFMLQATAVAGSPIMGTYQNATIATAHGRTVIHPSSGPLNAANITAYTSPNFKGILQVNPVTGSVTVTNAYPAGIYNITVKATNFSAATTTGFTLTVNNGLCSAYPAQPPVTMAVGTSPTSLAAGDFNVDGKQDIIVTNAASNTVSVKLGDGNGGFLSAASVAVGSNPNSVAAGDFNGDGKQDFVAANYNGSTVSVRLGDGAGGFNNAADVAAATGISAYSVTVGDFNNDGRQDLAITDPPASRIAFCTGNGLGGFSSPTFITVGNAPEAIAVADLNGDGNQDMVVANYGSNYISVLLGNGVAGFTSAANVPVGANPFFIAAGDFNNDGKVDLATANYGSNNVSIRTGDGTGSFTGGSNVPVGIQPFCVAIGDFNADGKQDFATANYGESSVSIRAGNGLGAFAVMPNIAAGPKGRSIILADFNGDGRPDIAATSESGNTASVTLGSSSTPEVEVKSNNQGIFSGANSPSISNNTDFGNIGNNTTTKSYTIKNSGTGSLTISTLTIRGSDSAQFKLASPGLPSTIAAGDSSVFTIKFIPGNPGLKTASVSMTNDDCDEAFYDFAIQATAVAAPTPVLGTYASATITSAGGNTTISPSVAPTNAPSITAYTSPGFKGSFQANPVTGIISIINAHPAGTYQVTVKATGFLSVAATSFTLTVNNPVCSQGFNNISVVPVAYTPTALAVADFNNDGKQDLITAIIDSNVLNLKMGNGSGGFTGTYRVPMNRPASVTTGDFNGDGNMDFASGSGNSVYVRLGNGLGGFIAADTVAANHPTSVAVGDFNSDGKQDLAIANYGAAQVSVCLGDGSGNFSVTSNVPAGNGSIHVIIEDFNGDGKQDFLSTNDFAQTFSIYMGNGSGGFTAASEFGTGGRANFSISADFDSDGLTDLFVVNYVNRTIWVYKGNGAGNFAKIFEVATGYNLLATAVGDFNGDGNCDFVSSNPGDTTASIWTGNGAGSFTQIPAFTFGSNCKAIAVGDFNNDGRQDIANTYATASGYGIAVRLASTVTSEISISGNNATISDGDNTPSFLNNTDFGNSGSNNAYRSYKIRNTGAASLSIRSLAIKGPDAALFRLSGIVLPLNISSGDSASFTINFVPASAGDKSAVVEIYNNDCDEQNFDFAIRGSASATSPVLGTYAPYVIASAGKNATVPASGAPVNTASAVAYTSPNFKGLLQVNPATGAVVITNAHPAGSYIITVKAFNFHSASTTNFTLTVNNTFCGGPAYGSSGASKIPVGTGPSAMAIADFNNDGKQDMLIANSGSGSVSLKTGNGLGSFTDAGSIAVGANATCVAAGDFNGDGFQDFVATNYNSNTVSVRLGNESGSFTNAPDLNAGAVPYWVTVADFNGDAKQDIAVSNAVSGKVSVCLGNGSGGFGAATAFAVGTDAESTVAGDFNGDGNQDFAAVCHFDHAIAIRLGNGAGGFTNGANVAVGTNPYFVTTDDFNNDGKTDLITTNFNGNSVSVRMGNGTGGFTASPNIAVGKQPFSLSVGDFNGDGNQDFVTANYGDTTLSVRLGNGMGIFTSIPNMGVGVRPRAVVLGDFNNDGRQDIAVTNETGASVTVRLATTPEIDVLGNNISIADGTNTPAVSNHTDYGNVVTNLSRSFTIKNTGTDTLIVSNIFFTGADSLMFTKSGITLPAKIVAGASANYTVTFTPSGFGARYARVNITTNDCDESTYDFAIQGNKINLVLGAYPATTIAHAGAAATIVPATPPSTTVPITARTSSNFKGLLHVNPATGVVTVTNAYPAGVYIVTIGISTVTTSFTLTVNNPVCSQALFSKIYNLSASKPAAATVGDFNSDGIQDLLITNSDTNYVTIRSGIGNGTFTGGTNIVVGTKPYRAVVGDFNADGKQDFAVTTSGFVAIKLGDGSGGFSGTVKIAIANNGAIAIGDMNNDGTPDLVVPNYGAAGSVLMGNGMGDFNIAANSNATGGSVEIAVGDFNNDGNLDIAGAGDYNTVFIRLGNGAGGFTAAPDIPAEVLPNGIATGDFNGDGKMDLAVSSFARYTVVQYLGNGLGGFTQSHKGFVSDPLSVTTGDFNGDGKLDYAVCNAYPYNKSAIVMLCNGSGGIIGSTVTPAAFSSQYIVTGEFNNDGIQDFATVNKDDNNVTVFLGEAGEVNLKGNGTDITAGDMTPSVSDHSDFDSTATGIHSFTIQNTGSGRVTINSITIRGADSAMFLIGSAVPVTIPPDSSVTFTVTFMPTTPGLKTAVVSIATNDCDESLYEFAVQGTGVNAITMLATYAGGTVAAACGNTTIIPSAPPQHASGIFAYTSSRFKGLLHVNPVTGVLTVTNAYPAGVYNIVLKAINGFSTTTTSCTLTVNKNVTSTGVFTAAPNLNMSDLNLNQPFSVVTGDFNGDGKQDLASVKTNSPAIEISLGSGAGTFSYKSSIAFSYQNAPLSAAIADVNGDGKQDILSAIYNNPSKVVVRPGDGTGNFGGSGFLATGNNTESLAVGDLNGDGIPDVVTANSSGNNLSIRTGDGRGNFVGTTSIAMGSRPRAVAIGDFNNDGYADIAVAVAGTNSIAILLGTGGGNFGNPSNVSAGAEPIAIAIGDFNNDGLQDLAIANYNSNNVAIRLGDGLGNFTGSMMITTGNNPRAITTGDFNGDEKPDLAVANYSDGTVSIRFGDGLGIFSGGTDISVGMGPRSVTIGDFDGNGLQDMAVANSLNKYVSILLGSVNGIDIEGNNTSIADGDAAPFSIDQTDFGTVEKEDSLVHTFTIDKKGNAPATINNISLEGPDTASFKIGGINLPVTIPNGGTATFTVTFKPGTEGLKTAMVNINNNACDDSKYEFALQGATAGNNLDFDGIDDYITINSSTGNIGSSDASFSAWVKTSGTTAASIISKHNSCVQQNFMDFGLTATGRISMEFGDGLVSSHLLTSKKSVNDGVWHHITAVRQGARLTIYIDGLADTTRTTTTPVPVFNNAPLLIGASGCETPANFFGGQIDEVRLWSRALSECEIQNSMQCELVGSKTGLLTYYQFNQGRALANNEGIVTLTDSSGNINPGILNNFALAGSQSNWSALSPVTTGVTCNNANTWLGISAAWSLPANWSRGFVPLECTDVIINNGVPFMPEISDPASTCFSLMLNNGSQLTVKGIGKLVISGKK